MSTGILDFQTDPALICKEIEEFIRVSLKKMNRDGAVVGLSGGQDSAVVATLLVRSLGKEKVHLLNLPEMDSNPIHREHAKRFAAELGLPLKIINISSILKAAGTYRILPLSTLPGRRIRTFLRNAAGKLIKYDYEKIFINRLQPKANSWMAKSVVYGMSKCRIRMVLVYQFAEIRNLMVVGAANRTEYLTGTFSQWGVDHCADIMPVIHIYRSQLEQIAEYIQVPTYIREKPSDPDLSTVTINKGDLLGGYETTDHILYNLERNVDKKELYKTYDRKLVNYVFLLHELSRHMRETPYHL